MSERQFKFRILVVDDDEALLAGTAALLSREGYLVETARDGFEALGLLRDIMPEVLISELNMPNMSGFELLALVRKRFPAIGVIALSSEFSPLAMPEGVIADRYLDKGANAEFELLEAVREVLAVSPLRTQPARPVTAPMWLPRSNAGYIVITCPCCLRSFSVLRRHIEAGRLVNESCVHCGQDVSYRIDNTTIIDASVARRGEGSRHCIAANKEAVADSARAIEGSNKAIADSKMTIANSKKRH